LKELKPNKQQKRKWEKAVESTNFVHSNRKAWNLLRKLGICCSFYTSNNKQRHSFTTSAILQGSDIPKKKFVRHEELCAKNVDNFPSILIFLLTFHLEMLLVSMNFTRKTS
jgi:hypothetical protein